MDKFLSDEEDGMEWIRDYFDKNGKVNSFDKEGKVTFDHRRDNIRRILLDRNTLKTLHAEIREYRKNHPEEYR